MSSKLVFLAHPAGPGPYLLAVSRARLLQAGAERLYPRRAFCRALGCTPYDDVTTGVAAVAPRRVEWARRMILGDGAPPAGSARSCYLPGCVEVWIVGPRDDELEQLVQCADEAGIPVRLVGEEEQEQLLQAGMQAELQTALQELRQGDGKDRPDFWSAEAVVHAYFHGAEGILSVQALPVVRLMRCGGNAYGRKSRIEEVGLRISKANGIIVWASARPGWRPEMLPVLWVSCIERGSLRRAAEVAGLGDGDSAGRQAGRLRGRALDLISEVLDEMNARDREEVDG